MLCTFNSNVISGIYTVNLQLIVVKVIKDTKGNPNNSSLLHNTILICEVWFVKQSVTIIKTAQDYNKKTSQVLEKATFSNTWKHLG